MQTHSTLQKTNYQYQGHLKKAVDIAHHYGFNLLPPLSITAEDKRFATKIGAPEDVVSLLNMAKEKHFFSEETMEPVFLAYTLKVPYKKARRFSLHALGSNSPLAETLLLQVGRTIISEYGNGETVVRLNSVGGHESAKNFREKLKDYYRSNAGDLEAKCQETLKNSVEEVHTCTHKGCEPIRKNAPQSLNSLTSASRRHLKDLIERLELLGIPYHLDHSLVGNLQYSTRTIFEIHPLDSSEEPTPAIARGERYDALSKQLGGKSLPGVHLSIEFECPNMKETIKERSQKETPEVFLVQLGFEAKMRALQVSEALRQSKICIQHHLTVDSLTTQLEEARQHSIPRIVILGQKEVQDGTVIVRNMNTLDQNIIPIAKLSSYLKRRV